MKKITDAGNFIIRLVTGVLATVFLIYGILMLWDMYRTQIQAFATYDLMKYRPNIEDDEPPYLDDLIEINPDTAAWITIYNTNIDYPVMQGEEDNTYINTDVYGKFSISGSIFMASRNAKDFSDPYTLIYGHHMENGSMFGDVMKFKNKMFFEKNDTGVLIMTDKVYDLKIMACLETDAYDSMVYRSEKSEAETEEFLSYLKSNAMYWHNRKYEKVIALSTCDNATTSGRTVLVCAMTTRKHPLPDREYGKPIPHREAMGHPMAGAYWGLLNLICFLATIYYAVKANIRKERISLLRQKNRTTIKITVLELMLIIASTLTFLLTEDLHKPIQMIDTWTLPMVILFNLLYAIEWLAYRKKNEK